MAPSRLWLACRLQARGLKVLVEKKVARTEVSQFSAFNPGLGGDGNATGSTDILPMLLETSGQLHVFASEIVPNLKTHLQKQN